MISVDRSIMAESKYGADTSKFIFPYKAGMGMEQPLLAYLLWFNVPIGIIDMHKDPENAFYWMILRIYNVRSYCAGNIEGVFWSDAVCLFGDCWYGKNHHSKGAEFIIKRGHDVLANELVEICKDAEIEAATQKPHIRLL